MWFERANSRRVTRNNTVRHNLLPRVIESWNGLTVEVRDAPTVSSFKRLYRRHAECTIAHVTETG